MGQDWAKLGQNWDKLLSQNQPKVPNAIGVPIVIVETCPFDSRHRFDYYDQSPRSTLYIPALTLPFSSVFLTLFLLLCFIVGEDVADYDTLQ